MPKTNKTRILAIAIEKGEDLDTLFDRVKKQLNDGSYDLSKPSHKLMVDVFLGEDK